MQAKADRFGVKVTGTYSINSNLWNKFRTINTWIVLVPFYDVERKIKLSTHSRMVKNFEFKKNPKNTSTLCHKSQPRIIFDLLFVVVIFVINFIWVTSGVSRDPLRDQLLSAHVQLARGAAIDSTHPIGARTGAQPRIQWRAASRAARTCVLRAVYPCRV